MKNAITTVPQAKTAVSALRRELKVLSKGSDTFTHSECLEILAKTLGYPSWNAWQATLVGETTTEPAAVPAVATPKYPLTNNGSFDFITPGETGLPYTGNFVQLTATMERLEGQSKVVGASRATGTRSSGVGVGGTGINVQHWGSAFGDTSVTQTQNGNLVWLTEDGDQYAGAVVFAPEKDGASPYDETLPIRAKLLEAYLEYYAAHGVDDSAREGVFEKAEAILGIWLTEREAEHLLDQLREAGLA